MIDALGTSTLVTFISETDLAAVSGGSWKKFAKDVGGFFYSYGRGFKDGEKLRKMRIH